MTLYTTIDRCRSCHSTDLTQAIDLGHFMLSDFLESTDAHSDTAPLVLVRCADCSLVQLQHTVDRERLYRSYWYRSSTQPAMVEALKDVVADATRRVSLSPTDVVLDIGANDGTLLGLFPDYVHKLAYEPALNLHPDIRRNGGVLAGEFFPLMMNGRPVGLHQRAKVITSCAVFYDAPDPDAFVAAIKTNLADDGVWINQLAYLPTTLESNNFGDIVHEHLTYWTVGSFAKLLKRHGLLLVNWSHNDVNGGSVRFIVAHDDGRADLSHEWYDPVGLLALKRFGQRIRLTRSEVRTFLHTAKREGKLVTGYAAATKFNTALQYWGIGPDLLPAIADRNPDKWGKFTPTGQIVVSEEEMRDDPPDYLFVGAYHFLDAFMEREAELLEHGTRFVVPFPTLQVIGGDVSLPSVVSDSAKALAS